MLRDQYFEKYLVARGYQVTGFVNNRDFCVGCRDRYDR